MNFTLLTLTHVQRHASMEDAERLRAVESEINEVVELMSLKVDRDQASKVVSKRRKERDESAGSGVFHQHQNKQITTTQRTKAHMALADALKHRIRLGKYFHLEQTLGRLLKEQVSILERDLKRSKH